MIIHKDKVRKLLIKRERELLTKEAIGLKLRSSTTMNESNKKQKEKEQMTQEETGEFWYGDSALGVS